MKKKLLIVCGAFLFLFGCGSVNDSSQEPVADVVVEADESAQDNPIDDGLNEIFNQCTGIFLWYDYTMNSGGKGPIYQLTLRGDVAEFSVHANIEDKRTDYVKDKFYTLLEIVKASNPKLYDINEHADENGKIIYETLNPAVELYTPGKGYYLDIEDTSAIEAFFNELIEISGFQDNESSSSTKEDISENLESNISESEKTAAKSYSGPIAIALTGGTRVRAEANTDSEIIAQLGEDEQVPVLDGTENDEWIKVDVNGDEGYVPKEYLRIEQITENSNNASSKEGAFNPGDVLTIKSTTNIRSKMDNSSSKVAVAYEGDTVTVVMSYAEGWTKVKLNKKVGFIRTDLLAK